MRVQFATAAPKEPHTQHKQTTTDDEKLLVPECAYWAHGQAKKQESLLLALGREQFSVKWSHALLDMPAVSMGFCIAPQVIVERETRAVGH
jgi:hypothetical protein